MYSRPWTEEERAVLMELAKAGVTASVVARKLQRSKNSVLGFANRQFGGYGMVKPTELKPLHVPKKPQHPRKDGLSPTGRSLKSLPPEEVDAVITPPEPAPESKPVRMMQIGRFQCRYIVSDVRKDPNPLMCGSPVKGLKSWCPYHYRLVFNPVPPKKPKVQHER
jgi:hypothetical protein